MIKLKQNGIISDFINDYLGLLGKKKISKTMRSKALISAPEKYDNTSLKINYNI